MRIRTVQQQIDEVSKVEEATSAIAIEINAQNPLQDMFRRLQKLDFSENLIIPGIAIEETIFKRRQELTYPFATDFGRWRYYD